MKEDKWGNPLQFIFFQTTHGRNTRLMVNRIKISTPFSIQSTYYIDKRTLD